jgi:hypothetical protein
MFKHVRFPIIGKPLGNFLVHKKISHVHRYVKYAADGCPDTDCNWDNKKGGTERKTKKARKTKKDGNIG